MIGVFDFIDKGMEINTNDLEIPEAKSLLLKIFSALDIQSRQPGVFKLEKPTKKYDLRFYRLVRNIYKERYERILDYLKQEYPLKGRREIEEESEDSVDEAQVAVVAINEKQTKEDSQQKDSLKDPGNYGIPLKT